MHDVRCPVVVGRARELAALRSGLAAARLGRGSAIALLGEAGIGKSRLVQEARSAAQAWGIPVLIGRAVPSGDATAFRPIAEALLAGLRSRPDLDPGAVGLAGTRGELGRLLPGWRRPGDQPDGSVLMLAEAVLRLLGLLAADGLLLVLEDLHWADPETLAVVEFLADNTENTALLLTARDEPDTAARLAATLARRGACTTWGLEPLTGDEIDAMITACSPGTADHETVRQRSAGLPLLVEELLAAPDAVPRSVTDAVRSRLVDQSGSTREALAVAAVLGTHFDWRMVADATDLADDAALDAIRAGVRAGLVDSGDEVDEFQFRHALVRDAVLADLLPPDRARWAERALAAVRERHPELDGPWCDVAAEIAVAAGNRPAVAEIFLEAGRRNLAKGALVTAEATLRRARETADDVKAVDRVLAEVLASAGKTEEAAAIDRRLLDSDPGAMSVRIRLARTYARAGRWAAAEAELAQVPADGADGPRATVVRAAVALEDARPDDARSLAAEADALGPPDVRVDALLLLSRLARRSDLAAAEELAYRAQNLAEEHGLAHAAARATYERSIAGVQETLRVDLLDEAREQLRTLGDLAAVAVLDLQEVAIRNLRWEPAVAVAAARRCIASSRRLRLAILPKALVLDAAARVHLGDDVDAELEEAIALAPDDTHLLGEVWGIRAMSALERGDDASAHEWLTRAMELFSTRLDEVTGSPAIGLWLLTSIASDPARTTIPALRDPITNRWNRGMALFADAVARGRRGEVPGAEAAFDDADQTLRQPVDIGWHRLQARRLAIASAIADGWGKPGTWLVTDLAEVEQHGRERWSTLLRSELRRAGVAVPRGRSNSLPPALRERGITAREAEVLDLIREGIDNHQIAERLVLSVRTVEKHVERLLAKTGTTRRPALVAEGGRLLRDR